MPRYGVRAKTGVKLWECAGVSSATASSTPVARDGIVYVMGAGVGNGRNVMAVRAGGKGDVSQTHVVWKQKAGANHCSPVVYGDFLFYISGQACCLRADTGAIVYQERLYSAATEYSSPIAADGKLFAFTRHNGAFVLEADGKFAVLARGLATQASSRQSRRQQRPAFIRSTLCIAWGRGNAGAA